MEKCEKGGRLLRAGISGSVIVALCCFAPALILLLGATGLSAAPGRLDDLLLPALAIFLSITGVGPWTRSRTG